jgi:uncharacterized protein DUF6098
MIAARAAPGRTGLAMRTIDDLNELEDVVAREPAVYVRYSQGPDRDAHGTSRDYEAGLDMPGLSVTPLTPERWWTRPAIDWIARRVCKYMDLADVAPDRRPWILTGDIVGNGPDHEPLVGNARPIAWLGEGALRQARQCYHERFDAGRGATD